MDNGIDDRDSGGVDGDGYKSVRASHDTSFFDGVSHLLVTADRKTHSQIKSRDNHDTSFFDGVSHLLVTADRKTQLIHQESDKKSNGGGNFSSYSISITSIPARVTCHWLVSV